MTGHLFSGNRAEPKAESDLYLTFMHVFGHVVQPISCVQARSSE